jgi:anti-sigma regulatory factor (Ser/Thr protein kinase)
MSADRGFATDGTAHRSELDVLRTLCWRQRQEIRSLSETIAVFRTGASSLAIENDELRVEVTRMRSRARAGTERVAEARYPLDAAAASAARRMTNRFLRDQLPPQLVKSAVLVASELVTNAVRHSGGQEDEMLRFRLERTAISVRIEVEDPGNGGPIAMRVPDDSSRDGFGLFMVERLSELWGAERSASGTTRVWPDLTVPRPVVARA